MLNNVWTSIPFLEITLTGFCNTAPRIMTSLFFFVHKLIRLLFQNHPHRYVKPVSYYSDTAIDQRKIRWLERDLK
jgi:hypothetical protein